MSTFITKQDQINEDIKQIGIFLWVVTAIYALQTLFLDPYLIFVMSPLPEGILVL